jgi:hypothetical protein
MPTWLFCFRYAGQVRILTGKNGGLVEDVECTGCAVVMATDGAKITSDDLAVCATLRRRDEYVAVINVTSDRSKSKELTPKLLFFMVTAML